MSKIPFVGSEKSPQDRLDEIFSRQMLGSVFVGGAASKIFETGLKLIAPDPNARFIGWVASFVFFVVLFIYWEKLERTAGEATEAISDDR